jgi:hypothetical protein
MGALQGRVEASAIGGALDDCVHGARSGKATPRGPGAEKDAPQRVARTVGVYVGGERFADVSRRREAMVLVTFAALYRELPRAPADVVELQADDLAGAETQPC